MPSNPDSRISFRSVELAQYYDENYSKQQRSLAAKRDLERYNLLMGEALQSVCLNLEEAVAVWSVLNGTNTSHAEMLPILRQGAISELSERGHIELAQRLKDFTLCQWIAVVDACDRVGRGSYSIADMDAELKRVGLVQ